MTGRKPAEEQIRGLIAKTQPQVDIEALNALIVSTVDEATKALRQVQITVPKGAEETAREFYCGLLGLPELEKPDALKPRGGFWLVVGDRQVHVGVEDGFDRRTTKGHIAYAVRDIDHWRNRLTAAGVQIEEGIQIPELRRFEFRDPFGNRIEMVEPG